MNELSLAWQHWIVENKLRQVPDTILIQTMVRDGIDLQIATNAVNTITANPLFQTERNLTERLKKLESILEVKRQLSQLSPKLGQIERRSCLSRQEFLEHYYATNTPVILTDIMQDWRAMSVWSPEYLQQKYGDVWVEIQANRESDPDYELNCHAHKMTVKFGDYIETVVKGGESNDCYMVANNHNLERDELKSLLDDIVLFPDFLDHTAIKGRVFFWLGAAGTITPLHHDPVNLMMAQVYGRKRWQLISPDYTPLLYNHIGVFSQVDLDNPDYERYPLFKEVKGSETILEPGEVIFVPVGWWHHVKALDTSISLSFTNFSFPNQFPSI